MGTLIPPHPELGLDFVGWFLCWSLILIFFPPLFAPILINAAVKLLCSMKVVM